MSHASNQIRLDPNMSLRVLKGATNILRTHLFFGYALETVNAHPLFLQLARVVGINNAVSITVPNENVGPR